LDSFGHKEMSKPHRIHLSCGGYEMKRSQQGASF
jgi:hypothetical protein